jgi:exosome complex component RRP42
MTTSLSPSERSYILAGLIHPTTPTRQDGRPLLASRPVVITYDVAPQANGSARVVLAGGTEVVAGIRLEVGDVEDAGGWRGKVEVDV